MCGMQFERRVPPRRQCKPNKLPLLAFLVIYMCLYPVHNLKKAMNIRQQMDPLHSFKLEIENMFDQSFQELTLKNNLNKTILSNLMEAARDQQQKISTLDRNIESLKSMVAPDTSVLRNEVNKQEEYIYDNFNKMMTKLNTVEEGITKAKRNLEGHLRNNAEVNQKLEGLTKKLEKIEKEEGGYDYRGTQEDLLAEMEDFEKLISQLEQNSKSAMGQLDFNNKIHIQEPLNTFETKMMLHNKNNEEILRNKLREFTDKLKKMERKIEETTQNMNSEFSKSTQQQKRIIEEMNLIEGEMHSLRSQLEETEQKRKQNMQSSAATLDNLVEQMLYEAKKLEVRVQTLRKGYQQEHEKVKKEQIYKR